MTDFLYAIVGLIAKIHTFIMTWNDSCETVLTDKQLHFLIIGLLGMGILMVILPLFKLLSRHHVLIIAWIYVFTVIIVITFAIEIGQGLTGTGVMDIDDVKWGLGGFMAMFLVFAIIRGIILAIVHLIKEIFGIGDDDDD